MVAISSLAALTTFACVDVASAVVDICRLNPPISAPESPTPMLCVRIDRIASLIRSTMQLKAVDKRATSSSPVTCTLRLRSPFPTASITRTASTSGADTLFASSTAMPMQSSAITSPSPPMNQPSSDAAAEASADS